MTWKEDQKSARELYNKGENGEWGKGGEGVDCKRKKIIPILALLEKRESYCRTKNLLNCSAFQNFYCTLCSYLCMAEAASLYYMNSLLHNQIPSVATSELVFNICAFWS